MNLTKYKRSRKDISQMLKKEGKKLETDKNRDSGKYESLLRAKQDCSKQIKRLRQEKSKR